MRHWQGVHWAPRRRVPHHVLIEALMGDHLWCVRRRGAQHILVEAGLTREHGVCWTAGMQVMSILVARTMAVLAVPRPVVMVVVVMVVKGVVIELVRTVFAVLAVPRPVVMVVVVMVVKGVVIELVRTVMAVLAVPRPWSWSVGGHGRQRRSDRTGADRLCHPCRATPSGRGRGGHVVKGVVSNWCGPSLPSLSCHAQWSGPWSWPCSSCA